MASARGKAAQSDRELRAAESGARIQHDRQSLRERAADRDERGRQFDRSADQRDQDLWNRQWNQRRADRAQRDADRAKNQADKARTTNFGTEGRDPSMPPSDPKLDESKRQFDESQAQQQRQFDDSQSLSAAKSGLQRSGGGDGLGGPDPQAIAQALEQNPDDPRLRKMMEEMQRGRAQGNQGLEQTGRRGYVPTAESMDQSRMDAETARMNAQTSRANAVIRAKELQIKAQQLQAEIDAGGAGSKEAQAKLKAVNKKQQKALDMSLNTQISFSKGEGTDKQWSEIQKEIDAGTAGGIQGEVWQARQDEVSKREYGPALKSFLAERTMTDFVKFVTYAQGKFPEGVVPDVSTEAWQEFTRNGKVAAQMMRAGLNAELYPVQETEQWKRMVNQTAGFLTLSGKGKSMQEDTKARTSESDVMRGTRGQLQEEAELPGGGTTRRQLPPEDWEQPPNKGKAKYVPPERSTQRYGTRGGLSGNLPYGV